MDQLKHLLSPITIKKTEIPNRVVMPPMGTALCNPDGTVNDALLAYMSRQASSGAGLIPEFCMQIAFNEVRGKLPQLT